MNKLYAFLALVFLTACGSPGLDGTWSGVGEAEGYGIELPGSEAKLTEVGDDYVILCDVESPNESKSNLTCNDDGFSFGLTVSVDGDNMTATEDGDEEILNFVRN